MGINIINGLYIGHKTQNKILLIFALILALLLIILIVKRPTQKQEGFTQKERFLVRRQLQTYDDFTAQIYDRIYQPNVSNQYIFDAVSKLTQMDETKSVVLDAGCGTGELIHYMSDSKHFKHVYGVDQSKDMIQVAMTKNQELKLKQADITHPMAYDKNTFTHIFMTGFTIYDFQDKTQLFRNLYYWLIPHGYLILQVVDRMRFDPIPLTGKPLLVDSLQLFVKDRVTDTEIDFKDFTYKSTYDFTNLQNNQVTFQETFIDGFTRNVRMNEKFLYMESIDDIIYKAQYAGFLVHGQMNMSDSVEKDMYKYIFILERPN
jgi:ubiquinone/menaquinone biosynthesis C-methylase UbiE